MMYSKQQALNILGLSDNPKYSYRKDDIRKAYHACALKYHPDKNNGQDDMFKKVQTAYETLGKGIVDCFVFNSFQEFFNSDFDQNTTEPEHKYEKKEHKEERKEFVKKEWHEYEKCGYVFVNGKKKGQKCNITLCGIQSHKKSGVKCAHIIKKGKHIGETCNVINCKKHLAS